MPTFFVNGSNRLLTTNLFYQNAECSFGGHFYCDLMCVNVSMCHIWLSHFGVWFFSAELPISVAKMMQTCIVYYLFKILINQLMRLNNESLQFQCRSGDDSG